jgi:hypothetical protein
MPKKDSVRITPSNQHVIYVLHTGYSYVHHVVVRPLENVVILAHDGTVH